MNNIQIFNNPDFGSIRTVIIDGEPWFVAKDIAERLGYSQTANMMKLIDENDKKTLSGQELEKLYEFASSKMDDTISRMARLLSVINESGLYDAIFGSKLMTAKQFKRWVTSEVLPQIRKTGSYVQAPVALPQSPTDQIKLLAQGHVELAEKVEAVTVNLDNVKSDLEQFKEDCPLFPVEAEQIVTAAKRKGVNVMGGKDSDAYHDRSLVQLVYRDLYSQIHRNFQINTYKALRRGQLEQALDVIERYELPIALADKIRDANAQISLF